MIADIEGKEEEVDISKQIAQVLYSKTTDIALASMAMDLYKTGEADITHQQVQMIKDAMNIGDTFAFIKIAVFKVLDKIK